MHKYKHHKYTFVPTLWGSISHRWELVGPMGAIHFHAHISRSDKDRPEEASCGLEYHHTEACNYAPSTAPDHVNCPLTGGHCWHDGTSLYAIESVWPMVLSYLKTGDHEQIFKTLEYEYDSHFNQFDPHYREPADD